MAEEKPAKEPVRAPPPLDGLLVVSLEQAIAAPFLTRQLADLGARVIKIERPDGGDFARAYDQRARGLSSHFVWVNRGKQSMVLDLKQARDVAVVKGLALRADVFVQNLAPGAADRMGLGAAALMAANPRLVVCDISGYGNSGPYRDRKAYDLMIQAESGFLSVTGTADEPAKAGSSIADIAAAMVGYSSVLAALLHRQKTGKGSLIDVSMLEALAEWMSYPLYYSFDGAAAPERTGAAHATIYPYGPFKAGDGSTVMLGIQNEREWAEFCSVALGDAALAHDSRFTSNELRHQHRSALEDIILQRFAGLTAGQIIALLGQAKIANAKVNTMQDVWQHPQLRERQRWQNVDSPVGPLPSLKPPGTNSSFDHACGAIPALGADTSAILKEFNL